MPEIQKVAKGWKRNWNIGGETLEEVEAYLGIRCDYVFATYDPFVVPTAIPLRTPEKMWTGEQIKDFMRTAGWAFLDPTYPGDSLGYVGQDGNINYLTNMPSRLEGESDEDLNTRTEEWNSWVSETFPAAYLCQWARWTFDNGYALRGMGLTREQTMIEWDFSLGNPMNEPYCKELDFYRDDRFIQP